MKPLILASIVIFLSACTIKRPLMLSTTSLGPSDQEEVVGLASGSVSASYFLCWPTDTTVDYSLQSAIANALKGARAHALINVAVDENCDYFFLLWTKCELRATGTAIRYKRLGSNGYAAGKPELAIGENWNQPLAIQTIFPATISPGAKDPLADVPVGATLRLTFPNNAMVTGNLVRREQGKLLLRVNDKEDEYVMGSIQKLEILHLP